METEFEHKEEYQSGELIDRTHLSEDSTKQLADKFGSGHTLAMLLGERPINPSLIDSYEKFDDIYRIRHDIVHSIICGHLDVPFGEKPVHEILIDKGIDLKETPYYSDVKNQTPDYFSVEAKRTIRMIEISISSSDTMKDHKRSKYALLQYVLSKAGFKVIFQLAIINPFHVYMNRNDLIRDGLMNDVMLDVVKKVCDNSIKLINSIRGSPMGSSFYLQRLNIVSSDTKIKFGPDDVIRALENNENKPVRSLSDLKQMLEDDPIERITIDDDEFIDRMIDVVMDTESPLTHNQLFDESSFIDQINSMSNTNRLRSIMPMPYMELNVVDSSVRDTNEDLLATLSMASKMIQSGDEILEAIGKSFNKEMNSLEDIENKDFQFRCPLPQNIKERIAVEGPGRKKYIKKGIQEHINEQEKNSYYALSWDVDLSDIEGLSWIFSSVDSEFSTTSLEENTMKLANLRGPGLDYAKLIQSISRELNINSLRGNRRSEYVLKPTGVDGVFIIIYEGPKLRCGDIPNLIWYKILIDSEIYHESKYLHNWMFKSMNRVPNIYQSRWLSTDANRLDHMMRCYDKILMTYYSVLNSRHVMQKEGEETSLIRSVQEDKTNTLGLIILTYLEDRRCTSKLLQNVRYLFMTSISIYRYFNDVMDKCLEPVRSPLQLYFIKRMVSFISRIKEHNLSHHYTCGDVYFDQKSGIFRDKMGGALLEVPRLLSSSSSGGDLMCFQEALSEMYFCMLFNKNQDDPTHSSFQILSKMLKGEENIRRSKESGMHFGYSNEISDINWAKKVIEYNGAASFSSRAIEIGMKLRMRNHGDIDGEDIRLSATRSNMNKTVDQFATFKSSAINETKVLGDEPSRNRRRRCLEGVEELVSNDLLRSNDVAEEHRDRPISFQIFKKNQIGGVREILILDIESRISINILETLSRNICRLDGREMLTHGNIKVKCIRKCLHEVRKLPGRRMTMFMNMDKSRWGPRFVPFQFLYLFKPYKNVLGNLYYFIMNLLIRHQNKQCYLPRRLVDAWLKDQDNEMKHKQDPNLQKLKEKFLKDRRLYFVNESNMGQGILHYTSSLLHSAMVDFRDEMYSRICERRKWDPNDHVDLFSSDDSFTAISIPIKNIRKFRRRFMVFLKCQEVSERLFNVKTSLSKTSINPLIGEFNSMFMSNLTLFPTLIKFCLSSVQPVNTDSFYRMVKEHYSASRQILENGGSLELYMISMWMNKRFCESIYHTGPNMANDLRQLGVQVKPYQLGHFPIFNPALMAMFGPEYHNYLIYKTRWLDMSDRERILFKNSHKITKGGVLETFAELEEGDTIIGGLLRVEAKMGPIRQLQRILNNSVINKDEMESILMADPLITIRRPETKNEILFMMYKKLYNRGAKEALKTICSSIYYGRVSATVSAKAFYIPNHDMESKTYFECIEILSEKESKISDDGFHRQMKFLYPRHKEYEKFIGSSDSFVSLRRRDPLEIQSYQILPTYRLNTRLVHNVSYVLEYLWNNTIVPDQEVRKMNRDVNILKDHYPVIKDTLEETMDQFGGEDLQKVKMIVMLLLKLHSLKDRKISGVFFGEGSSSIEDTFRTLVGDNSYTSRTTMITNKSIKPSRSMASYEDIYLSYNHHILSSMTDQKVRTCWSDIDPRIVESFLLDSRVHRSMKKRVMMCLASFDPELDLETWTGRTSLIMVQWMERQSYNRRRQSYAGDARYMLFMGKKRLVVEYIEWMDRFNLSKNDQLEDPKLLHDFLSMAAESMGLDLTEFLGKVKPGQYGVIGDKVLMSGSGFAIKSGYLDLPVVNMGGELRVDEEKMVLYNNYGDKICRTSTGLLNFTKSEVLFEDFLVYDMKFSSLIELGAFGRQFDIAYKFRSDTLIHLDDLKVGIPEITEITKKRLKLGSDFRIRSAKFESNIVIQGDVLEEEVKEEKTVKKSLWHDIITKDIDLDELSEFARKMGEDSMAEDYITDMVDLGAISSLLTSVDIINTRQILMRIKYLKHDLICSHLLSEMRINSQTIRVIFRSIDNKHIRWSLISYYDRNYANSVEKSPKGVFFVSNPEFESKFGLDF